MAAKKPSPTFEFTKKYLTKKPAASFPEVQAAAQKKGLKVIPVVYGRAKKLLGLVDPNKKAKTTKKRATRKTTTARKTTARKTSARKPGALRRGRPAASDALTSLEGALKAMRGNDVERERYRRALVKIQAILADVLD